MIMNSHGFFLAIADKIIKLSRGWQIWGLGP